MADDPKKPTGGGWGGEPPAVRIDLNDASTLAAAVQQAKDASSSADSERNFYVAVTIYGGVFVTGLFLLGDNSFLSSGWWYGLVFAVGGGFGTMTVTPLFRPKLEIMRSSRSLWAAAVATWLLLAVNIGFAVHDYFWPKAAPLQQATIAPDVWPALSDAQVAALSARVHFLSPEEIAVACETIKCRDLADGIAEILRKTDGWKVSIVHHGGLDISGVAGIKLLPNEPATEALRDAIEATTGLAVTLGTETRKDLGSDSHTYLTVGTRPF